MSANLLKFDFHPVDENNQQAPGSNELYANGRHQVKVRVIIRKQVGGVDTPLTQAEKDSLRIVNLNGNNIPSTWEYTTVNNGYTLGLRSLGRASQAIAVKTMPVDVEQALQETPDETFYFYLSSSDPTLDSQDFEAIITIDGIVQRSGSDTHGNDFITIDPTHPYVINSNELIRNQADEHVIHEEIGKNEYYDVYIAYWSLPYALTIKEYQVEGGYQHNNGLHTIDLNNNAGSPARTVSALLPNITSFKSNSFWHPGNATGSSTYVEYNTTSIRASRATCQGARHSNWSPLPPTCYVTIIDEYGCVSRYVLYSVDNVTNVEIRNAN